MQEARSMPLGESYTDASSANPQRQLSDSNRKTLLGVSAAHGSFEIDEAKHYFVTINGRQVSLADFGVLSHHLCLARNRGEATNDDINHIYFEFAASGIRDEKGTMTISPEHIAFMISSIELDKKGEFYNAKAREVIRQRLLQDLDNQIVKITGTSVNQHILVNGLLAGVTPELLSEKENFRAFLKKRSAEMGSPLTDQQISRLAPVENIALLILLAD
jgi:hypothetical protein